MTDDAVCCACGSTALRPHLRVAGQPGREGLVPSTDRFGTALADLVRCAVCGHAQLESMPEHDTLVAQYAEAASRDYLAEEAGQRATARAALARIERHAPGRRLLDVGCWVGFLLDEAGGRGWDAAGVEPSAWAAAQARARASAPVHEGDLFSAALPARAFDAVVLGDVLEHLVEPAAALDRVGELLVPRGVLHLALPDAGSRVARLLGARWWSVIPTHVQYFTRESLALLLRRCGFEPLWLATAPKAFSVGYYLGRVGGYSPRLGAALVAAARAAGVAERPWAPDFRDRMQVVALAPQ